MIKKISLALVFLIALLNLGMLSSCEIITYMDVPTLNGASLEEYMIIYDEDSLDYNKRAAEYIKNKALEYYNIDLAIEDDDTPKTGREIVVGETSREISGKLDADTKRLEFAILAQGDSIAMEGEYFVIAAAAYFFVENYASSDGGSADVPSTTEIHMPIVKEAKNFVLLIGDGMGVYQTKLFEYMENNCEYGDGEDIFYGYMLPYLGMMKTDSLSGTTDSAAGGTALSCGYKTLNNYVGVNIAQKPVKNLVELANEKGKASAVMSTETNTGATPSAFLAHVANRDFTSALTSSILKTQEECGTVVDCGYDYYTKNYVNRWEGHVTDALAQVSENKNGFFFMYEEAHIDKHCHNNDMENTFLAVIRFNQIIARFMEFAFYNPETMIIITADHETGMLYPDEDGTLAYHYDDHSSNDVFVFAYGYNAELFDGKTIENIQVAHTIAALMGDDNFGDQSTYQSLTK